MSISNDPNSLGASSVGYNSPLSDSKVRASEEIVLGKKHISLSPATSWAGKQVRKLLRAIHLLKPAESYAPNAKGSGASPTQGLSGTPSSSPNQTAISDRKTELATPNQSIKPPIDDATRREQLYREISFNDFGNNTDQESLILEDEINQFTSSSELQGLKQQLEEAQVFPGAKAFQLIEARLQELNPTRVQNQDSIQKPTDEQIEQISDQLIGELNNWADKNLPASDRLSPSATPKPTAGQPLTEAQKLKQITRYGGDHGQIAKSHLVTVSTGDGQTAPIHGSKVTPQEGFDPTILMQAPTQKAIGHMLNAMQQEQVSVIVDLTEEKETQAVSTSDGKTRKPKVNKYYPDELGESKTFSSGSKQFKMTLQNKNPLAAGLEQCTYILNELDANNEPVTTRPIQRLHVKTWKDHQGISPEHLKRAIQETDRIAGTGTIAVHCSAGIGRTGTFVATRTALHRLGDKKGDKTPSLDEAREQLTDITKDLRKARNPRVIQQGSQVATALKTILTPPATQAINEPIYENKDAILAQQQHKEEQLTILKELITNADSSRKPTAGRIKQKLNQGLYNTSRTDGQPDIDFNALRFDLVRLSRRENNAPKELEKALGYLQEFKAKGGQLGEAASKAEDFVRELIIPNLQNPSIYY